MNITEDLTGYNLLFEVEDVGTAYNPTGLSVSLWNAYEGDGQYEAPIPMDRHAEHKTTRATGKIWAVGMNNNCFSLGEARLAIQCGPTGGGALRWRLSAVWYRLVLNRRPMRVTSCQVCDPSVVDAAHRRPRSARTRRGLPE